MAIISFLLCTRHECTWTKRDRTFFGNSHFRKIFMKMSAIRLHFRFQEFPTITEMETLHFCDSPLWRAIAKMETLLQCLTLHYGELSPKWRDNGRIAPSGKWTSFGDVLSNYRAKFLFLQLLILHCGELLPKRRDNCRNGDSPFLWRSIMESYRWNGDSPFMRFSTVESYRRNGEPDFGELGVWNLTYKNNKTSVENF